MALAAGYELGYVNGNGVRIIAGCVANPTLGAMGYHYFNRALIDDLVVDRAEAGGPGLRDSPSGELNWCPWSTSSRVLVEPARRLRDAGSNRNADAHPGPAAGPGFWIHHAWVWKHNPAGMFADWGPAVACPYPPHTARPDADSRNVGVGITDGASLCFHDEPSPPGGGSSLSSPRSRPRKIEVRIGPCPHTV